MGLIFFRFVFSRFWYVLQIFIFCQLISVLLFFFTGSFENASIKFSLISITVFKHILVTILRKLLFIFNLYFCWRKQNLRIFMLLLCLQFNLLLTKFVLTFVYQKWQIIMLWRLLLHQPKLLYHPAMEKFFDVNIKGRQQQLFFWFTTLDLQKFTNGETPMPAAEMPDRKIHDYGSMKTGRIPM